MSDYAIGIDTGGTCTDGVIVHLPSLTPLVAVKEATTHHDLSLGIGRCLARLLWDSAIAPGQVGLVALSSTLATNAVVEERGARVGLFVFGHVRHFKLPVVANIFLKGGHTITGEEDEPLDLEGLVDTLEGLREHVDAYAVCSAMSFVNPAHELVATEAIRLLDPKPVFCSHLVSEHAGMRERAATACLHARLMPLMEDFLRAIERAMSGAGLSCPLLLVRGDGQPVAAGETVRQAAVTVASGPASTAWFGAMHVTGDALVVDVGGTTTDICLVRSGNPVMNEDGCRIGAWQTHVAAVDMYTAGAGGDSLVSLDSTGRLQLAVSRVQPLAMTPLAADPADWLGPEREGVLVLALPDAGEDDEVLAQLRLQGPATAASLARSCHLSGVALDHHLEGLRSRNQVIVTGFTPTDALHVLGRLQLGDSGRALGAARRLAALAGLEPEELCRQVLALVEERIAGHIIEYLMRRSWGDQAAAVLAGRLEDEVLRFAPSLKVPLVGIGAAARHLLPGVAERLHTTVSFPAHYEVGNAIGALRIALSRPSSAP
ncbi:MAG: hydantoinase/oxoprolinase [Desulfobulbaceae bacterium A2]|nr:MAG: hydantoinase/oxoprolinase [Desulfobulbaceae bacterium A2]